jgi:hypothetical protein
MLNLAKSEELVIHSFEDLQEHVAEEQKTTFRLPFGDLVSNGGCFFEDQFFGDSSFQMSINERAMNAFAQSLKTPVKTLNRIERVGLASDVLNDAIHAKQNHDTVNNMDLIVDGKSQKIIGCVTGSYVEYSNQRFLDDLSKYDFESYQFQSALVVNTRMVVKFLSTVEAGVIDGKGGRGIDETRLGLACRNSMVGDSAVRPEFFMERKICENGLFCKVGGSEVSRVNHSGKSSFQSRLHTQINGTLKSANQARELVETLGAIPFDAPKLLSINAPVFEILPEQKEERKQLNEFKKGKLSSNAIIQKIKAIPFEYGGETTKAVFESSFRDTANMWDFCNVFTEKAKEFSPVARMEVETATGDLAAFVMKHKKHFS